jgi:hypothetical protein
MYEATHWGVLNSVWGKESIHIGGWLSEATNVPLWWWGWPFVGMAIMKGDEAICVQDRVAAEKGY